MPSNHSLVRASLAVSLAILAGSIVVQGIQAPPTAGPYTHQVLSASSPDGLTWTHDGVVLLEHASVPCVIVMPDGQLRIYYVDASQMPETVNCAESADGGTSFEPLGLSIAGLTSEKAVDPSIVRLENGRYRLFYYGANGDPGAAGTHYVRSAISDDGVHFRETGTALAYPGLVDPDVFKVRDKWLMFVFSLTEHTTMVAESRNGRKFRKVRPLGLDGFGTTKPVQFDDGRFRLYAFDQRTQRTIVSFVSEDGLEWSQEAGVRLDAPIGKEITDPQVVRLPDGGWKMVFKVSDPPVQ
ncbi:MAG: hypothetical protein WBQ66_06785 [Blastocatellia bacterium]